MRQDSHSTPFAMTPARLTKLQGDKYFCPSVIQLAKIFKTQNKKHTTQSAKEFRSTTKLEVQLKLRREPEDTRTSHPEKHDKTKETDPILSTKTWFLPLQPKATNMQLIGCTDHNLQVHSAPSCSQRADLVMFSTSARIRLANLRVDRSNMDRRAQPQNKSHQ